MDIHAAIEHYRETLKHKSKSSDKHLDGFSELVKNSLSDSYQDCKEKHKAVIFGEMLTKRWDLVFDRLAALEFKSIMSSSFGKSFNCRKEEAIGMAIDARLKNKKLKLGYLIILEDDDGNGLDKHQKLSEFCQRLKKNKIYDDCLAIVISDNSWSYIFNDYESFTNALKPNRLLNLFRKGLSWIK